MNYTQLQQRKYPYQKYVLMRFLYQLHPTNSEVVVCLRQEKKKTANEVCKPVKTNKF